MAVRINKDDFEEKVLKSNLPVIVDFYSDSCIACKKLAPALGDVEDDYEGKLYVYKVNTNFDKELAKKYQIAANPTLLFVKNAEVLDRKIGAHTLAELDQLLCCTYVVVFHHNNLHVRGNLRIIVDKLL